MTPRQWASLFALALVATVPRLTRAQIPAPPVLSAPASDSLCTYDRCALWLDAPGLLRGAEGHLVARRRWFRPLPLRRLVTGDSALHYATRYEREWRHGNTLSLLGTLAITAGMGIAFTHDCLIGDRQCDMSNGTAVATFTLLLGGFGLDVVGERSSARAARARARALWWHNRQFAQ
jgi:hypothetical protein